MDKIQKFNISDEELNKIKLKAILDKMQFQKIELENKITIIKRKIKKIENEYRQS